MKSMKSKLMTPFSLVVGLLVVCGSLFAHHGSSISYNMHKTVTLKGVVTEFVWTNPHCQLYFDVKDNQGNLVHWGGEAMAPRLVSKLGLTKTTLKPGDGITINVFPSKAGVNFGLIQSIVLPSGQTLTIISPENAAERSENGKEAEKPY